MNAQQATELNGGRADVTARQLPSPTNSSCAVYTAVGVLDSAPDDDGGTGDTGGGRQTPRPTVQLSETPGVRTLSALECGPRVNSTRCQAVAGDAVRDSLNREQRSTIDPSARAATRFQQELALRPCTGADAAACETARTAAGEAAPVVYADVQASTLLGFDTLPGTTVAARTQRFNEALLYCANLMVPENKSRVSGDMSGDRAIQQAMQRAGDARVSLAISACADAVGRRQGIEFDANNATYDWIIAAACSYRRAFTSYNDAGDLTGTLTAPNSALNSALDAACPAPATRNADGSTQPVRNVTSSTMHLSRLELLRIISTDMFTVPQFALHSGSANTAELQRMLIAMESVNSQLNMEMLRMQEQLNMIEAASLSVDVKTK